MSDRMRPPARRTSGRPLGGAQKATAASAPPPPPAAELTPEQLATEESTAQDEGRLAADAPRVESAASAAPGEASTLESSESTGEVAVIPAQPSGDAADGPEQEGAIAQGVRRVDVAPEEAGSAGEVGGLVASPSGPAVDAAAREVPSEQVSGPGAEYGPSGGVAASFAASPGAELGVRSAVPWVGSGVAFPVRADGRGAHEEQDTRSYEVAGGGTPYAHGPGRPQDIPEVAVVLNRRVIARESLDSSVPAALKLKKRIKRFALDNELDHLPIGDIVSVALDEWLTARGF